MYESVKRKSSFRYCVIQSSVKFKNFSSSVVDTLSSKRDQIYDQAVVAKESEFDATWDRLMEDYLSSGAKAIMEEREAKWNEYFGDATILP